MDWKWLIKMCSKRYLSSNFTWLTPASDEFRGDHQVDERNEALLWGRAEKIGIVQPGREKALSDLTVAFQYLKGTWRKDGARLDKGM